jgi:hypothetical protein
MSLFMCELRSTSVTVEDCAGEEPLDELREANSRLKILVCELLVKNQQLRSQRLHETSGSTSPATINRELVIRE